MPKKYRNVPNSLIPDDMPFMSSSNTDQLEPDYQEHFDAWKQSDTPQTRNQLLKATQPVIDRAVYSYAGNSPSPYIKSQAKLMALDAFGDYNPAKGNLRTHLLTRLQRLQRTNAQNQQIISIPERVAIDRRNLFEVEERLRDELGRDPSDAEIADYTGLSLKRIGYIRNANTGINTGSIMDEEGETFDPGSIIPGNTQVEDAWREMIYYDLQPVDQAIMDYTLGLHGAPVLENRQIASRLGISEGAISQRKNKIQALLDERFNISPFGDR